MMNSKTIINIIAVIAVLLLLFGIAKGFMSENKDPVIIDNLKTDVVEPVILEKNEPEKVKSEVKKIAKSVKKKETVAVQKAVKTEEKVETNEEDAPMFEEIDISEVELTKSKKPVYQKVYLHDGRILIGYVNNLKGILIIDTADKRYEIEENNVNKIEMMAQP